MTCKEKQGQSSKRWISKWCLLDHTHKLEDTIIQSLNIHTTLQEQQDIVVLFSSRKTLGNLIIINYSNTMIQSSIAKRKEKHSSWPCI